MESEGDIDVAEAARIAGAVVLSAVHDLSLRIPKRRQEYPDVAAEKESARRRWWVSREIHDAVRFFEDKGSNFGWMAAGLGIERKDALRALRPRMVTAKHRLRRFEELEGVAPGATETIEHPALCGDVVREPGA